MAIVKLLHNPGAGDKGHDHETLARQLEAAGHVCRYSSTKEKGWDDLEPDTEIIAIAGGDGTIRKVAKKMLQRKLIDKQLPIGLIPSGTANNIAKTLGIPAGNDMAINLWDKGNRSPFDAGKITGFEETGFFIESFGLGLFPHVMRKMKEHKEEKISEPEKKIKKALELFREMLDCYVAPEMYITADDTDYSGRYIMAELMNTNSIGPRMVLNPQGDPGDGCFELILVPEDQAKQLASYLEKRITGKDIPWHCKTIKATQVDFRSTEVYYHADDEVLKIRDERTIRTEILKGVLEFFVK